MKILMISAGLPPKHGGGLPAYLQELLTTLGERGHNLIYLDTNGVQMRPGARLERATASYGTIYTLINSGVRVGSFAGGTREPLREVMPTPQVAGLFDRLLVAEKPDIIHVHEMMGLPSQLIARFKSQGYKVAFTCQDHFSLCPTVRLFLPSNDNCNLATEDLVCGTCCANAPYDALEKMLYSAIRFDQRHPRLRGRGLGALGRIVNHVSRIVDKAHGPRPQDYIMRRREMVRALESFDAVLCMSHLQKRILAARMPGARNLRVMYLSRKTLFGAPQRAARPLNKNKMVFLALNINSTEKGLPYLLAAFREVAARQNHIALHVYGADGASDNVIVYKGAYDAKTLPQILEQADCGVIPSLWQESYGYVGAEMLSYGLPLLVSNRGGMVEYVENGKTGLVFDPDLPNALRDLIEEVACRPQILTEMQRNIRDGAQRFKGWDEHIAEVERFYHELQSNKTAGASEAAEGSSPFAAPTFAMEKPFVKVLL